MLEVIAVGAIWFYFIVRNRRANSQSTICKSSNTSQSRDHPQQFQHQQNQEITNKQGSVQERKRRTGGIYDKVRFIPDLRKVDKRVVEVENDMPRFRRDVGLNRKPNGFCQEMGLDFGSFGAVDGGNRKGTTPFQVKEQRAIWPKGSLQRINENSMVTQEKDTPSFLFSSNYQPDEAHVTPLIDLDEDSFHSCSPVSSIKKVKGKKISKARRRKDKPVGQERILISKVVNPPAISNELSGTSKQFICSLPPPIIGTRGKRASQLPKAFQRKIRLSESHNIVLEEIVNGEKYNPYDIMSKMECV